jgi:hypothetical protein
LGACCIRVNWCEVLRHDACCEGVEILPGHPELGKLLRSEGHQNGDGCILPHSSILWVGTVSLIGMCDHVTKFPAANASCQIEGVSQIDVASSDDVCGPVASDEQLWGIVHTELHADGCVLELLNGFVLLMQTQSLDVLVEMLPDLLELDESFEHHGYVW